MPTPKQQVHNLIILDESGSMDSIKPSIIQGFNELVQTIQGIEHQFPDQEHFISMISFNGLGIKALHILDPVSQLRQIDASSYQPNASTPLYDAIGLSVNKLKHFLARQLNYNVLVTILTDGEENASCEFSGKAIKEMIEELKSNNWTFTYIGTDHDIDSVSESLSIDNRMAFDKNVQGINAMFEKEKAARMRYSQRLNDKEDLGDGGYFEE